MVIHICIANSNALVYNTAIVSYLAMILFGLKILTQKRYKGSEIILLMVAVLIGCITFKESDDKRVLWFVIVLCASKDIEFDKTVKYSFNTMLFCCITFFILFKMGIIDETLVDSARGVRHSYGLGHPNMFSAYYILLIIQYIYLHFKNIKFTNISVLIMGSFIVYFITKSKTGLFTALAVLMIVLLLKYVTYKKINSSLIIIALIIGIVLFTIMPLIYNDSLSVINTMMTGRLQQANFYFQKYGIHLFGSNLNADLTSIYTHNILDIGYAKMLINNGLIYYLTIVIGYVLSMLKASKTRRYDLVALMACFIIYMFTENVATYIFMNVTMLLFSNSLKKDNVNEEASEL
jgi:hypothetical protein